MITPYDSAPSTPMLYHNLSRSNSMNNGQINGNEMDEMPSWIPDAEATHCMGCKKTFGFTRRKHHCRNCGWVVCSACSSNKFILSHLSLNESQRVCNNCYTNLHQVKQLRQRAAGINLQHANTPSPQTQRVKSSSAAQPYIQPQFQPALEIENEIAQQQQPSPKQSVQPNTLTVPQHQPRSMSADPVLLQAADREPSYTPAASAPPRSSALSSSSSSANFTMSTLAPAPVHPPSVAWLNPSHGANGASGSASISAVPTSSSPPPVSTSSTGPQMLPLTIPDWTYLFKPFSTSGSNVSIGRIGVTIHSADDLPKLESLFAASLPFVKVRMGAVTKFTHSGAHKGTPNGLAWDQNSPVASPDGNGTNFLLFDVPNVLETLYIELWLPGTVGLGDATLVCSGSIQLKDLCKPENSKPELSNNNPKMDSYLLSTHITLNIANTFSDTGLINSLGSMLDGSSSRAKQQQQQQQNESTKLLQQPKILVDLAYSFSKQGEFWSYFTPPSRATSMKASKDKKNKLKIRESRKENAIKKSIQDGTKVDQEESVEQASGSEDELDGYNDDDNIIDESSSWEQLDKNSFLDHHTWKFQTIYDLLRRTIILFMPILLFIHTCISSLSTWYAPITFIPFVCIGFILALKPFLIMPGILLLLLRYMIWTYVYKVLHGGKPQVLDEEWKIMTAKAAAAAASSSVSSAPTPSSKNKKSSSTNSFVSVLQAVNPLNLVAPLFKSGAAAASAEDTLAASDPDLILLDRLLLPHLTHALLHAGFPLSSSSSSSPSKSGSSSSSKNSIVIDFQTSWISFIEKIEYLFEVANWQRMMMSRSVFILLAMAVVYCYFAPQAYICAILLSLVLTRCTVIGAKIEWILLSIISAARETKLYGQYEEYMSKKKV